MWFATRFLRNIFITFEVQSEFGFASQTHLKLYAVPKLNN